MNGWGRCSSALLIVGLFMMSIAFAGTSAGTSSVLGKCTIDLAPGPVYKDTASILDGPATGLLPSSEVSMETGWTLNISFAYLTKNSMIEAACIGAFVELEGRSPSGMYIIATGYTNENGEVNFNIISNGTYAATVYTKDHGTVKVQNEAGKTYFWKTDPIDINGNATYELKIKGEERGAWAAYNAIRGGSEWLKDIVNWSRSQVTVVWPTEDWPHCHGNEIDIPGPMDTSSDIWDREVVLHEYGHAVHYAVRGYNFPDYDGPDTHYLDSESNGKFAFVEGWAEFFSAAAQGAPVRSDGTSLEGAMYADSTFGHGDFGDWDGNEVEGAVANVLWDIFDGVSSTDHPAYAPNAQGDSVDREFHEFWRIFTSLERPEQMMDIWKAWDDKTDDLVQIFRHARYDVDLVDPTNPTHFSSSHKLNVLSYDSTIFVVLEGAIDDSVSDLGYSIIWDESSNSIPDGNIDTMSNRVESSTLTPGSWYLHVRTVDFSGNVAEETYHIGPFLIGEGATDIDGNNGGENDPWISLIDVAVLIGVVLAGIVLVLIVLRMVRKPEKEDVGMTERERFMADMYSRWYPQERPSEVQVPPPSVGSLENYCPYCGNKDLHGTFCASCGKRLR